MTKKPTKSVVFITGTFLGNNCWDEWVTYFESKGYTCIAPAWPHKYALPEELRNRHPDPAIASNSLTNVIEYFEHIIEAIPEKPILIGHSLGGLVVQLLLQRNVCAAAVAIHSLPPLNTLSLKFLFLKNWWKAMGFFSSPKKSYMLSFRKWKNVIDNVMSCDKQKESFYKYAIPESKVVVRDILKCSSRIDFKKTYAPLLFTSGGYDLLVPAILNYNNYLNYRARDSITGYKHFWYHNHLVFDQPACKQEADYIIDWLLQLP
jgi:pimeloyl-ACP methyl ester carboxylesterase